VTAQLWIGFGFLALLVIFLIVSFFVTPKLTDDQRATLKVLSALCAGFSGGFLTGSALFELHKTAGATNYTISGTAGCALFLVVWIFYPKVFRLRDAIAFSIAQNSTFEKTVRDLTQSRASVAEFTGFQTSELSAGMQSGAGVSTKSLAEAVAQLRFLTSTSNAVRPYDVVLQGSVYHLKIR